MWDKKAFVKQPRQLALQQLSVLWQHWEPFDMFLG